MRKSKLAIYVSIPLVLVVVTVSVIALLFLFIMISKKHGDMHQTFYTLANYPHIIKILIMLIAVIVIVYSIQDQRR
jgi:cytochrome bd-type quinol oxidase subunit 2